MRILDTDYDSYMLLFHCREELPDIYGEEHRYDRAQETHDNLAYNDKFIKFRDALKKTFDLDGISEEEFEAEMNEFLALDLSHKSHFMEGEPSLDEWLEIRHLYADRQTVENTITHSQAISLFVRNANSLSEDQYEKLKAQLHEQVPEHDFTITHINLVHDLEKCMGTGDIFSHPEAVSQEQF